MDREYQHYGQLPGAETALTPGVLPGALEAATRYEVPPPDGLMEYWHTIRRHLVLVIAIGAVGTLAGVGYTLTQAPTYSASLSMEIQTHQDPLNLKGADATAGASDSLLTQTRVTALLQSQEPRGFRYPVSPAKRWLGRIGLFHSDSDSGWKRAVAETAASLVIQANNGSRIVDLSCKSADAQLAASFLNVLSDEYVKQILESRFNSSQVLSQWLNSQLAPLKGDLDQSEQQLQEFARSSGLIFSTDKGDAEEERLAQLQAELSKAQGDRIAKQAIYEVASNSKADSVPQILDSGRITDYQTKLADLRRELAELQSMYTPAHYKVKRVQAQITELEAISKRESADIVSRLGHDYDSATRRESLLMNAYLAQVQRLSQHSDKRMNYAVLQHGVDLNRDLYQSVLQKIKEVDLSSAMRASDIRVIDAAKPGGYRPDFILNACLGLFTGSLLAGIFVVVRDRSDRSLKSPDEVRSCLHAPELGVIPTAGFDRKRRPPKLIHDELGINSADRAEPLELALWQGTASAMADSFRIALASILFSGQNGNGPRLIAVTSPGPREGKSVVVSNLATAVAEINRRVLVIDADMRKPRLHSIFEVPNSWGLSDLLRENTPLQTCPLEALARATNIPGLYLLPSGPGAASIFNLLYSTRISELLRRVRQEFDLVLIDTPPMLFMPDARVLARLCDTAILVIRAGQTNRKAAMSARQRLAEDGTPLLGTILNAWDPAEGKYGYYENGGYYHQYATDDKSDESMDKALGLES
jgi:polysaccharide biosynthesis transport protein